MIGIIGKSGAYYVENPFGAKDYAYAKFDKQSDYGKYGAGRYISKKEAIADFEEIPEPEIIEPEVKLIKGYFFTIEVFGNEPKEIKTDTLGEMENGKNFKDYLQSLYSEHGRSMVSHKMQTL